MSAGYPAQPSAPTPYSTAPGAYPPHYGYQGMDQYNQVQNMYAPTSTAYTAPPQNTTNAKPPPAPNYAARPNGYMNYGQPGAAHPGQVMPPMLSPSAPMANPYQQPMRPYPPQPPAQSSQPHNPYQQMTPQQQQQPPQQQQKMTPTHPANGMGMGGMQPQAGMMGHQSTGHPSQPNLNGPMPSRSPMNMNRQLSDNGLQSPGTHPNSTFQAPTTPRQKIQPVPSPMSNTSMNMGPAPGSMPPPMIPPNHQNTSYSKQPVHTPSTSGGQPLDFGTVPSPRYGEKIPSPPSYETPFTSVTHYDMPPAMNHLQDQFKMVNPQLHNYYQRQKKPLRMPYPAPKQAISAHEPPTFGFLPENQYFRPHFDRRTANPMPPPLNRSQSMQAQLVSPHYANSPLSMKPAAKKARSASDSEEAFGMSAMSHAQLGQPHMPSPMNTQPMPQSHGQQQQMSASQLQHAHMSQAHSSQSHMAQPHSQQGHSMQPNVSQQPNIAQQQMPPAQMSQASTSHNQMRQQNNMGMMMGSMGDQRMYMMDGQMQYGGMRPMHNGYSMGMPGSDMSMNQQRQQFGQNEQKVDMSAGMGGQGHQNEFNLGLPEYVCTHCNMPITNGQNIMHCSFEMCKNVFHRECTGLRERAAQMIEAESPVVRFACAHCAPLVPQV